MSPPLVWGATDTDGPRRRERLGYWPRRSRGAIW